mmetsp:Transcript_3729/g.6358  ORF Transcript_3729/g.6358 Transcript_3729/m.6358 type:complete len:268 (-) Transcript_3729:111-914(-)
MLWQVDPSLPCFVQGHSMGCLDTVNLLINNPHFKVAGLVASSPFWGLSATHNIGMVRRLVILFLATFLEEVPINGSGSCHLLSHDKNYFLHELVHNCKRHSYYSSGGIINSMIESCEDISVNARVYDKPTLVFMAGKDRIINNDASRLFLRNCGVKKEELTIRQFANSYHNIHKEPEYKLRQLAEIYEFIFGILSRKAQPFDKSDLKVVHFERPAKKKSLKLKRAISIFVFLVFAYKMAKFLLKKLLILLFGKIERKATNLISKARH